MFMYLKTVIMGVALLSLTVPLSAASFDCDQAELRAELTICSDQRLRTLDKLMAAAWTDLDTKNLIHEQRLFLEERNSCQTKECLLKSIGIRIGELKAIANGFEDRIKTTPFRYVPPLTAFVRCRQNYQGSDALKYVELLFSFEEGGPTFKETNFVVGGGHSESAWDWLIWNAVAAGETIITNPRAQVTLRRNYPVSRSYIESLTLGQMFSWVIYADEKKGSAFIPYSFDPTPINECISPLR